MKIKFAVFALGIAMAVFGFLRGEALELLRKASIICMECIGLGKDVF